MQPWCTKKGLQLSLKAESGLPKVSADPGRVVQVLVNLLSNAIKFSPTGGRILVRISKGHGPYEGYLQYSIEDNGPGIRKEEQTKIFEKFFQIAAGERDMGGTGLGLAISKALIHMHNGRLWVESNTDKGSTFFFTLPIFMPAEGTDATSKGIPWWKRILSFK